MRRLLTLILVVSSFLLVALSGCSSDGTTDTEPIPDRINVEDMSAHKTEREDGTRKFLIDDTEISIDYAEIESDFLNNFNTKMYDRYTLLDSSEVTTDILESRYGNLIIERCIGIVTDENSGDGEILNLDDDYYYYISYQDVDGIRDGFVVISYLVYNPGNNYIDDIMERYDYIVPDTEYRER